MTFEKDSPEAFFFRKVDEFIAQADEIILECNCRKRVREEFASRYPGKRVDNAREKVCDSFEVLGNQYFAEDLLENLPILFQQLTSYKETYIKRRCDIAVKRSKLEERIETIERIKAILCADSDESISSIMNSQYPSEHMWKKDLPKDILSLINSFDKSKNTNTKRTIEAKLSSLSTSIIKKSPTFTFALASQNAIPDTLQELTELEATVKSNLSKFENMTCKLSIVSYSLQKIIDEANKIL
mgnify:FL=1